MKKTIKTLRKRVIGALTLCCLSTISIAQNISTVVGNGSYTHSGDGGVATSASMMSPTGLTFDASGNMYIAEFSGNYIRKVSTSGIISTIAGTGTASSTGDGGDASSATLNNPSGIAIDASGNIYIAEASGNRIRKINTSGIISTIAGTGTASSTGDGGTATSATLNFPTDIVFDASGNLYISENGGNRIRKINTAGNISTIAGNGTASSTGDGSAAAMSTINNPAGLAFDASGNLYIAENGGHKVRMINTSGDISTIAGTGTASSTGDGSSATSATIKYPRSLIFDSYGNLFIAEENGSRIRKINTSGIISTFVGTGTYSYSGDGGSASAATIKTPFGLSINSGNLFLTDFNAYVVRKVCNSPQPTVVSPITYCEGSTATSLSATGSNLLWYGSETGGTGVTTAPIPNTSAIGTTTYYVSQTPSSFGCESPRVAINVTINPTPDAPTVTTPLTYCEGVSTTALTATKPSSSDTLYWYSSSTGGTGSTVAPTPSSVSAGTTVYYVSARSELSCEGVREAISVIVNDTPSAPVVTTPVTYCEGSVALALTADKPSPTDNLYWYTTSTGGTGTTTAPTPITTSVGSENFYVSAKTTNGCEGARSLITVEVNPTPIAPIVTTPINYCFGATASALTATASGTDVLYWYTTSTGGTGSTTAPIPSNSVVGANNYYVSSKTTLGCEGPRAMITVNTNAIPSAPTVSSPVNFCLNAAATALTATSSLSTDVLYWYNSAIGGSGSLTAPTPTTSSVGMTNYYVSAKSSFGCEGPRALITVEVNPIASTPTVTTPIAYCENATAIALTATAAATTDTLYWYTTATGGTGSSIAPVPATSASGTTPYYVSGKNSYGCEGLRATLNVTINPLPSKPTVVSPINYCQNAATIALNATKASPTDTLYWYPVATGGIGTITAPTPGSAFLGTETYYVGAKSSLGCEGNRDSIQVITNPIPSTPVVSSPLTYCQNVAALPLTATAPSSTDTLYWYTSATGGTGSITPIIPTTTIAGTTNYYVSAKNVFGCEGNRDSITVNVIPAPAAPSVITPLNICIGATTSALSASGSDIKWYDVATGGTASTTAPTPSSATVGLTNYYVTQTATAIDGGCESPRAVIAVNIRPNPSAPAVVSPINLCQAASAVALNATTTSGSDTLYWYNSAIGGTGSLTAPTPGTSSLGNTDFFVSQKSVYGCEGERDTITVIVNAIPAAPTVSSLVTYCQGITASALTASGTNLKWYTAATGGTGSATAPTPSTATAGTTDYFVSQTSASSVGACESPRSTISVLVNAAPSSPTVTTPINLCVGGPSSALTATGTNLLWYTAATGGTGSTTAPTPTTATAGTTNYYVSQTTDPLAGSCEGSRATIAVKVNALPSAPTVTSPVNLCVSGAGTTLTATGSNLLWYTAATGGTGSATAPAITTGSASSTVYYVTQSLAASSGACESPRSAITATVNALPAAPTVASPVNLCIGSTPVSLSATGSNILWYTVSTGGTSSTIAPKPATTTLGSTEYFVSQTSAASSGSCESPRAKITAIVNPLPLVSIASTATTGLFFCKGKNITLSATAPTAVSYQWKTLGTDVSGATLSTYTVGTTGLSGVTVKDVYGCAATEEIYVQEDTSAESILTPALVTICKDGSALLSCSPKFVGYTFNWQKDGVSITPATPAADNKILNAAGSYRVIVTNNIGCLDTTNDAIIKHYPGPVKPIITSTLPKLQVAKIYNYYQWYRNGSIISGANNYQYITSSKGTYHVEVTDENGCTENSDTVLVETNSISNLVSKTEIKLYPNPTQNSVTIDAPVKVNIRVINMVGSLIMDVQDAKTINIENQVDGTYFFYIADEHNQLISVEKITKLNR